MTEYKFSINPIKAERVAKAILRRQEREFKTTYHIEHDERMELRGCWTYARATNHPFNTLLSLKFPSSGSRIDLDQGRYLVHKIRVYLRIIGVQSNILWSRHIEPGTGVEELMVLFHLPETAEFKHFASTAKRWNSEIDVEQVDYGATFMHKGQNITVFEYMFRSCSAETMHKDPEVLCEKSDPIVGPRLFSSFKLARYYRIEHKNATQEKEG